VLAEECNKVEGRQNPVEDADRTEQVTREAKPQLPKAGLRKHAEGEELSRRLWPSDKEKAKQE
jgi:hypothetical protein